MVWRKISVLILQLRSLATLVVEESECSTAGVARPLSHIPVSSITYVVGCLMLIATYLVVSRAPSPKPVICVCVSHVCFLWKQSSDMHGEGGRWLSRDHLYPCRHPPPPGLKAGHWSSPSGPPIACSLREPDWQDRESSKRHLPGYCFLIGNGTSSAWEWVECDPGILFLLLEMEMELLHSHLWKEVQDAHSQDMPIALTGWLPWLPVTHSPAWNSGPGWELAKDRCADSSMTLKPVIVSLQSAKQMHVSIKNKLETQTNQRWVGACACCQLCLAGGPGF